MSDAQIRAAIRDHNRNRARRDGLPVDDLPALTAEQSLELGWLLAGGRPRATAEPDEQPPQP